VKPNGVLLECGGTTPLSTADLGPPPACVVSIRRKIKRKR
jgi:hypothetical protein